MASKKEVQKVTRGVKEAKTPGLKPEKEETPIGKVISCEIAKIVEDINFDAKFDSIKMAIESKQSEVLLPTLESISDKLNAILGAMYGNPQVNDNVKPSALLGKLGNLNPKLTMYGPLDDKIKGIYDILTAQVEKAKGASKSPIKTSPDTKNNTVIAPIINVFKDELIQSINSNSKDIIDIISEESANVVETLQRLTNSEDFNLRTAQIIDAINKPLSSGTSSESEKLSYKIDINATGLDNGAVESLIELSKIDGNSSEYLENLNNLLSDLSKFEALNKIKLNNKNIEALVTSLNTLNGININAQSFDPFAIDCLSYFVDELGKIDFSKFDTKSLQPINALTSMLAKFNNLKLENFNTNIQAINSKAFVEMLENLKNMPKIDKNTQKTIAGMSDLFSSINSISGLDKKKFKDLSKNLRKIIDLTSPYTVWGKVGLSDKGLISKIMHNLAEIAASSKKSNSNIKNISKMLELITSLTKYDPKDFIKLASVAHILADVTDKKEPFLYKVFKNIDDINGIVSQWKKKNGPVDLIANNLKLINSLSSKVKLGNVIMLAIKSTFIEAAMYSLKYVFTHIKEIADLSQNVRDNIAMINQALDDIGAIKIEKISNLDIAVKSLIKTVFYLSIFSAIPEKTLNISKNVAMINNAVTLINTIETLKDSENLTKVKESFQEIIYVNLTLALVGITFPLAYIGAVAINKEVAILEKVIGKLNEGVSQLDKNTEKNLSDLKNVIVTFAMVNLALALIGVTFPLAFIGAFAIKLEVSLLSKIVGQINETPAIDKKVQKNLKDLALVIVFCSGMLVLAALLGKFVVDHFVEVLGFTAALALFIFLVIGALNIATVGMKEAITNAKEFGKLLLISAGIMILGASILIIFPWLFLGSIMFAVALGLFVFLVIGAFNLASKNINSAILDAKNFALLVGLSATIMMIGGAMMMIPGLFLGALGFTVLLTAFIFGVTWAYGVARKQIAQDIKVSYEFLILVGMSAIALMVGGSLSKDPMVMLGTLVFAAVLTAFIFGVTWAYGVARKQIAQDIKVSYEFLILVGMSAIALMIGGYLSKDPMVMLGTLVFAVILTAFIFGVTWAYGMAQKQIKKDIAVAYGFAMLVGISALSLCLGGYLIAQNPWMIGSIIMFGALLAVFVFGIIKVYQIATKGMRKSEKDARTFAIIVGVSAAAMLIGGLFMLIPGMIASVPTFAALLAGFIFAVLFTYKKYGSSIKGAKKDAEKFAIIVGISAAALLIGGLFMLIPGMPVAVTTFGFLLSAFMFAILGTYSMFGPQIKQSKKFAKEFAILVGVTAAALLIGGFLLLQYPGLEDTCITFALLSCGFIAAFSGVIWLLGKLDKKQLIQGELALGGIAIIIGLMGYAFTYVAEAADALSKVQDPLKQVGIMGLVIVAITGIAIGLGAIAMSGIGAGALALGEVFLAGVMGIIILMGKAFSCMAQAMKDLDAVKNINSKDILNSIKNFLSIVPVLMPLANPLTALAMLSVSSTVNSISKVIMDIATAVGMAADMKTSDGRFLTSEDFTLAAENVKTVVEVLGGALIQAYEEHPEMFSSGSTIGDLLGADTKLSIVAKSCMTLGQVITEISAGVKDFADLKMPIYRNGKIVDYRTMTPEDFQKAADAVTNVVTTLGQAMIDIYDKKPEMFTAGSIGDLLGMDTPFSRVAKSCATLGELITDIAAGVKDFADLKMPMYKDGKVVDYRTMTPEDFKNAGTAVQNVVETLGYALIRVYNDNKEMFGWQLIGDNPFAMVCKSTSEMGNLISSISAGIKDYADLRIPIYDENGKLTGYRSMGPMDFMTASLNIGIVITTLANALIKTYNDNPKMFTDPSTWHTNADKTPMGMVTKALGGVGTLIKDAALGIKEVAAMNLDEKTLIELGGDPNVKTDNGKVGKIVSILASSIIATYEANPDIFEDTSFWSSKPEKTRFGKVAQCLNMITPFIQGAIKNVDSINKMEGLTSAELSEKGELYKKIQGVVRVLPAAVLSLLDNENYKEFLEDEDNVKILTNMNTMFKAMAGMANDASIAVKKVLEIEFGEGDKSFDTAKNYLNDLIHGVAATISTQLSLYSNVFQTDASNKMLTVFKNVTSIVEELNKSYSKILESFKLIGISGTDSNNLDNIIYNLKSMMSGVLDVVLMNPVLTDNTTITKFGTNMEVYTSSINKLITTYSRVPKDTSVYDNVVKAIEGVNTKIAEIQNVDAFKQEQEALSKYVLTINNLDLTKTKALTTLMETMTTLASKLGALDKFTDTLNKKISITLYKLAEEIRKSGSIIYKADELQKKRQKAIKDSIKEIQELMSTKLEIEISGEELNDGELNNPNDPNNPLSTNNPPDKQTVPGTDSVPNTNTPKPKSSNSGKSILEVTDNDNDIYKFDQRLIAQISEASAEATTNKLKTSGLLPYFRS